MTNPLQDAADLLALEEKQKPWKVGTELDNKDWEFAVMFRRLAPAVIRALVEQMDYLDACARGEHDDYVRAVKLNEEAQARIETLEAERDSLEEILLATQQFHDYGGFVIGLTFGADRDEALKIYQAFVELQRAYWKNHDISEITARVAEKRMDTHCG